MNTQKFTMMIVSLAISVVLVAGLMVPVITSLGSENDGGAVIHTNTAHVEGTDISEYDWYVTPKDIGTRDIFIQIWNGTDPSFPDTATEYNTQWMSFENLEQNPDADRWRQSYFGMVGDYWYADLSNDYLNVKFLIGNIESVELTSPLHLEGDTITGTINGSDDAFTLDGVRYICCSRDMATYTLKPNPNSDDDPIYAGNSDIGIWTEDWTNDPNFVTLGFGKADAEQYTYGCELDYNIEDSEIRSDGTFLIEDGYITGASVSNGVATYTYDISVPDDDYDIKIFVPLEVREGGSGGSALPPTIMTLISIIPLLTVVGLIIGAVSFIRFKE